jgi:hypothetical protein
VLRFRSWSGRGDVMYNRGCRVFVIGHYEFDVIGPKLSKMGCFGALRGAAGTDNGETLHQQGLTTPDEGA